MDAFLKYGPVISGLLWMIIFWLYCVVKKKPMALEDMVVIGITASSLPSALICILAAFQPYLLAKLSESPLYIAIAGFSMLYITIKTLKEKL